MKVLQRMLPMSLIIFLTLFITFPIFSSGSDVISAKVPHQIPQTHSKMKIDGVLGESEWAGALVLTLNYEVYPGANLTPPVKTTAYLKYDAKHLYVAFKADDPDPAQIRAHVSDRDTIWNDDFVGIVLDTFNDSRLTHNLYSNPYGVQGDRMSTNRVKNVSWDAIWDSAGSITPTGYNVEMSIPFSSLRFQRKDGVQQWGIDVVRSYPRSAVYTIGLFPRDRSNNCYMCQADKVEGFSGVKPGKNLEFDPTLSATWTQERDELDEDKMVTTKKKVEPGLNARWSFTPNMTLNVAINPDFSQIEADTAQLNINTQFALYYPEKRPFFQEGSTIFESQFKPVYTRTIVDPEWGVKLTGKEGKNAIGFFSARDTVTNFIIPYPQGSDFASINMKNLSTAFRYRRDIGESSTLGFFATDREGKNYYNRMVGVDANVNFSKTGLIQFQLLGSQSKYPDQIVENYAQPDGQFQGLALDTSYTHNTEHVWLYLHYQDINPKFRADSGFLDQSGVRLYDMEGSYTLNKPDGSWYTALSLMGYVVILKDYQGKMVLNNYLINFNYSGPLQTQAALVFNFGKKSYSIKEFNDNYMEFAVQARPSGSMFMGFSMGLGDQVDFTNVQAGHHVKLNPFIQYNIGRRFYLGVDHVFERLNVDAGRLFTANLTNMRFLCHFNRRAFFRATLQYANYNYNAALYSFPMNPEFKHLFSQLLFSYKINPQTVLFLGYSDDYYGYRHIPIKQNNRTFFMKVGYAIVQ